MGSSSRSSLAANQTPADALERRSRDNSRPTGPDVNTNARATLRTIVYSGSLAQPVRNGGLSWFHLQFLLGFRRLGYDVLFVDRLEPGMCVDDAGQPAPFDRSANVAYFLRVMNSFGLDGSFSLIYNRGEQVIGLPRDEVRRRVAAAPLLLNVMGFLEDEQVLAAARRRVFLDIDPGFGQMWRELGLHDPFRGHDDHVTMGRNIGRPECRIPTCGLRWVTMPQPVVLEQWPVARGRGEAFTGIGAWRGPNGPIDFEGTRYGLRCHEFRRFASLPQRCRHSRFEMALDIHPADARDVQLLQENHWSLVAPKTVAGDPWAYRGYVAGSRAELMIPKEMYVATRSGLLSDRSVYYLASGRPVLARDTGIRDLYPTGTGLLTFSTLEEAAAGVEEINGNYDRHATAAREIAVEHFDSDKVLKRLLSDLQVE
jgi:glycosyltransferase involved in cell wall biosynthesis